MIELIGKKIILDNNYEIREYYTVKGIIRVLYCNGSIQSSTYIDKNCRNQLSDDYFKFYNLPIDLNPNVNDYLVLGGGGFSYPKFYISKFNGKKMDVVEIDRNCIEYAKKYFFLDDMIKEFDPKYERLNIIIEDAIKYIYNCKKQYDYILIDLFKGLNPINEIYDQFHLKNLKRILKKDGIIIINYIISNNDFYYPEELKKLVKITNNFKIISNKKYFNSINNTRNIIIILSDNQINIPNNYDYLDIINFFS